MTAFITYLQDSLNSLEETLKDSSLHEVIESSITIIVDSLKSGKALLICGNGGSASDAQHIAGELVGRYLAERKALKVICLSDNAAILTALGNDYGYENVFSRQVEAYGKKGAILLGISTSGNSPNVLKAFHKAKEMEVITIGLTGQDGGKLASDSNILINVPSKITPLIQQIHTVIYHYMCQEIEKRIFEEKII